MGTPLFRTTAVPSGSCLHAPAVIPVVAVTVGRRVPLSGYHMHTQAGTQLRRGVMGVRRTRSHFPRRKVLARLGPAVVSGGG